MSTPLKVFTESPVCASGNACARCREPERFDAFVEKMERQGYAMPEEWRQREGETIDQTNERRRELCPRDLAMGSKPAPPEPTPKAQPAPALQPAAAGAIPAKPQTRESKPRPPKKLRGSTALTVGKTYRGILIEEPPSPTLDKIKSYLTAMLTAAAVSAEIRAEREATCLACPHARWSRKDDAPWCSICGCSVGGVGRWLLKKLTAVAENLPTWGCHHPQRKNGAGWKR